jgi:ABC-type nitrate/sulfonate/bicarbonate transport system substrate-binding protein
MFSFEKKVLMILALLCGTTLAALPKASGAAALENVNAGFGSISGNQAPLWIAKEARLFEKQGLQVELVYIPGGPRALMALLGGSIQFLNYSAIPAMTAALRGAETVILGSSINRPDHSLVVKPSIRNVQELRGKTIGLSSLGSLTDILLTGALRLNGLFERDVKIVAVGGLAERVGAMQAGRIDGAMLLGAQMRAATKLGFRELVSFSKLPFEVSLSAMISTRSFILKQSEITAKFLRAWAEAIFVYKSNRELSLKVLRKYTRIEDRELLEDSYNQDKELIELEPLPSISAVKSMLGILARTQPEAVNADPQRFVEMKFMSELRKNGFFEEMKRQYALGKN